MIYARKGNHISRIEEPQIQNLVEQGYDIVDENGTVLHRAVPTDLATLKGAYIKHMKQIEELEKEVESLKKSAKKASAKEDKAEDAQEIVAEEKVEEAKPKRSAKK